MQFLGGVLVQQVVQAVTLARAGHRLEQRGVEQPLQRGASVVSVLAPHRRCRLGTEAGGRKSRQTVEAPPVGPVQGVVTLVEHGEQIEPRVVAHTQFRQAALDFAGVGRQRVGHGQLQDAPRSDVERQGVIPATLDQRVNGPGFGLHARGGQHGFQ